ncbi:MAG: amylo-alpha-1,6-glucosidase [Deltaproteobacteria bacterium]
MIELGRDLCSDLSVSGRREWLVTNGIGGYASGTVSGVLTRRYHGLLVAALKPPLGRTLLVAKIAERATYRGRLVPLGADRWASGAVDPKGFLLLDRFHLEGTTPVWTYALGDAILSKRIWMEPGVNTTYVRYDLERSGGPVALELEALVNYRNYHGGTRAGEWTMAVDPVPGGVRVTAFPEATPFTLFCDDASASPAHDWYRDFFYSEEAYRGLDPVEDHLRAAIFRTTLSPGGSITLVASAEGSVDRDGEAALARRRGHEEERIGRALPWWDTADPLWDRIRRLILAADPFLVRRATEGDPGGMSVIAGYPWFGDWGRDTMIALPGLTLPTGRAGDAARILRTFARFVDRGMLPNRFPDAGEPPEYNTVDATLWYFEAIRACHEATGDDSLVRDLFPVLRGIIDWHVRGTRYGIRLDPEDGLLFAGEPGVQLTWMDARVGDRVVTPRIGKPVEVNALWYNALRAMAGFARQAGESGAVYEEPAEQAARGFRRFWNESAGYCYDVIDGPGGNDGSLRPNQILAVSLHHSPLPEDRRKAVVDACARELLTPLGLRSLSPDDPRYAGQYGGDPATRDAAYHQGTVWPWLIGPFVAAHLRVYGDRDAARSFLLPLLRHLHDHGLGSICEIADGDPPHTPRGCIAQGWSVAELLRALRITGKG